MSDFVVSFDLLGRLSLVGRWDGERRFLKKMGDMLKLMRETLKCWKNQDTRLSNRRCGPFCAYKHLVRNKICELFL